MFNPFKDVTYHHHWKLMSVAAGTVFIAMIVAFLQNWLLLAVVLALGFLILAVQWLTIDPPDVTDEDVHGAAPKPPGASSGELPP
jgi:hypothetical protein